MQPSDFHPVLQAQIDAIFGNAVLPDQIMRMLISVDVTYKENDARLHETEELVKHRTDQLMASTSRAYSFLDSLNMGFIMCDTSGEVVLSNAPVRAMLSYRPRSWREPNIEDENLTADILDELLGAEVGIKDLIKQSLSSGEPIERPEVNVGKHILHLYLASLTNEPGAEEKQLLGVVMLIEDVTEQKLLERSKDEFLSIASHELRTPLTAIRGNTVLMKKMYGDKITEPDMLEMIDDIYQSSVRLIDIVNDFLDVAALEQHKITMKPEVFQIGEVVNEVVHELGNMVAEKNLYLVAHPTVAQVPPVLADRQRIKQVIINLVGNAVKFTVEGGITISAMADSKFNYVTVKDTGKGMSPENQKLLFRKFQQAGDDILTRETMKGTGLGLYISKQIVELSGGLIGLKSSAEGVGSEFVFSLPIANVQAANASSPT